MQKNNWVKNTSSGEPATLQHWSRAHRRTLQNPTSIGFASHLVLMILAGVCIIAVFAASAAAADDKRSLAVLNIESAVIRDQGMASLLTDTVRNEIVKTAAYSVMEQRRMIALLKDGRFPVLNCSTKQCAVAAGRHLGVQAVVVGTISKIRKTAYLSLSIIDVKTETIEFSVEDKCPGEKEELLLAGAKTARKLMGELAVTLPVSTLPENERFVFREQTAFDKELALVWIRDADMAGKTMTWDEANEYIQRLNKQDYAGYRDWRLPAKNEVAAILEYAKGRGKKRNINELFKNAGFKNMKAGYYWSGEDGSGLAWVLDMYGGEISTAAKNNSFYVWPVRTGPWLFEERFGTQ